MRTYEQVVQDEMDVRLLERLHTVNWAEKRLVLDFACGTGRIGVWPKDQGVAVIDGVDLTPAMLAVARRKDIYRSLHVADVGHTGLRGDYYDLCIQSLADEHMPDLHPLYREAARLTKQGGQFVIVGFHPQILMAGLPTHFDRALGEPVTIRSYVHLLSDHVKAAHAAGWILQEMDEGRVDEAWAAQEAQMGGLFWPAGQLFNGLAALSFPNYE